MSQAEITSEGAWRSRLVGNRQASATALASTGATAAASSAACVQGTKCPAPGTSQYCTASVLGPVLPAARLAAIPAVNRSFCGCRARRPGVQGVKAPCHTSEGPPQNLSNKQDRILYEQAGSHSGGAQAAVPDLPAASPPLGIPPGCRCTRR